MKIIFKKSIYPILVTLILACTTILYIIQKTAALAFLRPFSQASPVYLLWFLCICSLAFMLRNTWKKDGILYVRTALRTFLPSAIILCLVPFFAQNHIHWAITASIGFYFVTYGFFFIYTHHIKHTRKAVLSEKLSPLMIVVIAITSCVYLFFGVTQLGKAFYVDEKLWIYDRIETYWDNIITGDWYNTRPSDKPGVTTALVSGPGLLFFDPSDFHEGSLHKEQLENMFTALRLPLFLTIFLLLIFTFTRARTVLAPHTSALFFIFLTLSPLLVGIARMINPDSLLWIFFIISFLCFFRYLFSEDLPSLYVTGIFIGLALLTKYIANIFIVFYFFALLTEPILRPQAHTDIIRTMRTRLTHFGMMLIIALSTFYLLYPGAWVKHDRMLLATIHSEAFASTWIYFASFAFLLVADVFFYRATITSIIITHLRTYRAWIIRIITMFFISITFLTLCNVYTGMSLFDFMTIIESPKSIYRDVSTVALFSGSFYPLLFGVTPLVFIGVLISVIYTIHAKQWDHTHLLIIYGILFIFIYYTGSIVNHVVPIVRYQIVLYPLLALMASIGWSFLLSRYRVHTKKIYAICIIIILCESAQLSALHHFYFSYNSPFLPKKYIINSKDMGDGNYEIAQYLNKLPHAQDLLIWTDKTGLCQFFVGSCNNMIQDLSLAEIAPEIDYYVISQNRQSYITRLTAQKIDNRPDYPIRLDRLYESHNKIFEILPGNRTTQFIRVIPAQDVSIINN